MSFPPPQQQYGGPPPPGGAPPPQPGRPGMPPAPGGFQPGGAPPGGPLPGFGAPPGGPPRPGFVPGAPPAGPPSQSGPTMGGPLPGGPRPPGPAPGSFGAPPASAPGAPPPGGMQMPAGPFPGQGMAPPPPGGMAPRPGPGPMGAPPPSGPGPTPGAFVPAPRPGPPGPPGPGMVPGMPGPGMQPGPPPPGMVPAGGMMRPAPPSQGGAFVPPPPVSTGGGAPPPPYGQPRAPGPPPGPYGQAMAPPGYSAGPPPPLGATYDPSASIMDQFQTLTLGPAGPGQSTDVGVDPAGFPRPNREVPLACAAAPPLVDAANCDSKFMRLTCNAIPNSSQLRNRWAMPLGVIVHPLAGKEDEVPVVPPDTAGIVRCRRCRTYINPFVQWSDGGRRFRCNVCGMINEVPVEYFCTLDANGRRRDHDERPELAKGQAEYVAPAEYMVRPPMPPVFFFVIDVTYAAVQSGMLATVCETIKEGLDTLPGGERTQVGFLTFDSVLHFYNLKSSLSQPQQMVVPEIEEPFVPIPDDLLVNLSESRVVVDALLDSLPATFAGSQVVDSCMGSALQAAFMVTSHVGGKMLLFQAAVPTLGPGKIKNRENAALYGTDREHTLRIPEDPFFKKFAAECSRVQITVDTFVFSTVYCDLASISALPKYTCGQVYYYPGFSGQRDAPKLKIELAHNLSRLTGWEAVMRIRCSKGLKISSFHGHFFIRSTDLLALPTIDPDKCFAVQIALEDTMVTGPVGYVQCALLYTASCGERRIRVHTMAVPIVSELSELYKATDSGALACMLGKLGVEKSYGSRLDDTRQALQHKTVNLLREFRMMHAAHFRAPNKMMLPEQANLLPLWTLALTKVPALRGAARDVNADERIAVGFEMMSASVEQMARLIYPNLYPVFDMNAPWGTEKDGKFVVPASVPLTIDQLDGNGAYLMDNGRLFILWLGRGIPPGYVGELFAADPSTLPPDLAGVSVEPERPTQVSKRICALMATLRKTNAGLYQQCFVVRQGSAMEAHALPYFVEDRGQGTQSYTDFLCSIHKSVMAKH